MASVADHPILKGLNNAQRRAVSSSSATVAILAGPGSGKTHTLTSRVVWLVDEVGYRPQDVVVATFTVKAAREMMDRIGRALGGGREKKLILGTFHSICRRYLSAYGGKIGLPKDFGIADDKDSRGIVERVCKRLKLTLDPPTARAWISKQKAGGSEKESARAKKPPGKSLGLQELQTCYDEYQKQLERSNLLDYDDLLVRCVELLRKFPSCVSNIQSVLIDEYQDTNGIQYELMKLFAQHRSRITIVGDPDQSIYGWRSAEIGNLWRLLREFKGTEEVSLEDNYRSSQSILNLSLQVIQQDKDRYKKVLKPVHTRGSRPVLRKLKNAYAEADWIVCEMRRVIMMSGNMLTHSDVAILLRSAALSRHIESTLGKAGIAYKMVGGFKFYDRAEIKTLLDYLRVVHQPHNNDALSRIMNVPKRGIGEGTIKNLIEEAEQASMSLWTLLVKHCRGQRTAKTKITKHTEQRITGGLIRVIEDLRKISAHTDDVSGDSDGLVGLIHQLIKLLDFERFLKDTHPDDHEQRWANVQEFINVAADFVRDLEQTGDDTLPEIQGLQQSVETELLPRFLANVSLASDVQTGEDGENKPLVTISTIHAAKGLEWPVVFIPAVYQGSIPHARSEDQNEERRLLYVAMTRAKCLLYLSCPTYRSNSSDEPCELSSFVATISRSFLEKGPCLDRPVMEQIAQIVKRKLPSNEAIYGSLPSMYSPEDDFGCGPESEQDNRRNTSRQIGASIDAPPAKRPRLSAPAGGYDSSKELDWRKDYATTMEQSSNFTVSSLPGFVSAGTHQATIMAAAIAEEKARVEKVVSSTSRRSADQKSILGFLKPQTSGPGSEGSGQAAVPPVTATRPAQPGLKPVGRNPVYTQFGSSAQRNPALPAIQPELSGHRLGPKPILRPGLTAPSPAERKHYTCFSSSPPRPDKPEDPGEKGDSGEAEENEPPPEPTRIAACMHNTTFNMPNGVRGGFRRPAGLGREGIAPMAQLRKPFKPLTMNRSL